MKAVLFYNYGGDITGTVLNVFEYFIALFERDPSVKLCILNGEKNILEKQINIVEDRCDLSDLNYKENIFFLPKNKIIHQRFQTILVLDYNTIHFTRGLILANKIVVIQEKRTHLKEYQYDDKICNCIYYGEMPFVKRHKEYTMKFLFHRYKDIKKTKEGIYINTPRSNDLSFLERIQLPEKPILFKDRINHLENLFTQFDTYVYFHANKWFDPSPRLFVESSFYGKDIYYFNEPNIIDGSYYRYHDVINNGVNHRYFSDEDEIIKEFICEDSSNSSDSHHKM